MDEIISILKSHKELFPLMQFDDVYKLIYQHCYGPKHMSMSKSDAFNSIKKEASVCKNMNYETIDIGNGFIRVSIVDDDSFIDKLCDAFINSINNNGATKNIEHVLTYNKEFICKLFCFDILDYELKINSLKEKDFPPMSHSEIYKNNYFPHYRVINRKFLKGI